jgi:hypothetical protein
MKPDIPDELQSGKGLADMILAKKRKEQRAKKHR